MTLNQLRYFCTASRCHSITKAAEELYVTQPTVSVAIRDLEIEFGISLFYRKGNRLILTEEGEELYNKATYILQYCTELQADYSSMARVKPPLRIGIPPMLSTVFFLSFSSHFMTNIRKSLLFWRNMALSVPAIWYRTTLWIWLW
ncbi:MAG: LysR family transcriptional regulator [Blautia wexlerae]